MGYTVDELKKDLTALYKKFAGEPKTVDLKLQDGTIVRIEAETPMVNARISAIDEAGNMIPLPTGNYVAEDGSMLMVTDGVITTMEPKKEEAPMMPATPATDPTKPTEAMTEAQAKTVIESIVTEKRFVNEDTLTEKLKPIGESLEKLAGFEEKFNKLGETSAEQINKLTEENKALAEKFTKQAELNSQLFELVKKIAEEPANEAVSPVDKKIDKDKFKKKDMTEIEKQISEFHKSTFGNKI